MTAKSIDLLQTLFDNFRSKLEGYLAQMYNITLQKEEASFIVRIELKPGNDPTSAGIRYPFDEFASALESHKFGTSQINSDCSTGRITIKAANLSDIISSYNAVVPSEHIAQESIFPNRPR